MPGGDVVAVRTDAGMLSVWCPRPFASVNGYGAWEQYVNDRLQDAIANGELVPVNIGSDGAWGVRVAIAPDGLTERDRAYAVVTSEPCLLVVSGGEGCLIGIEAVGDPSMRGSPHSARGRSLRGSVNDRGVEWGARGARRRWAPDGVRAL
jgi:hypothetical protein